MKIQANGIQINYELSGRNDAAVVMLSHSLACSLVMWQPQMAVLESAFQVLRFDTRGHGDSDAPQGAYSFEQLAMESPTKCTLSIFSASIKPMASMASCSKE